MSILDRYVARTTFTTFGVVLLFILGIFVVLSLFSMVDSLLEHREALEARGYSVLGLLTRYYVVLIPFIVLRLLPFITVVAGTIALIRLLRGNEITPMVAAGRSPARIALPLFLFGGLLSIIMLAMQEWVVPRIAKERLRLEWVADGNFEGDFDKVPAITDGAGNTFSMTVYSPLRKAMEQGRALRFRDPATGRLLGILSFSRATWREAGPGGPGWYPEEGRIVSMRGENDVGRVIDLDPERPLPTDLEPGVIDLEVARESREAGRMLSLSEAARMTRSFPDLPRIQVAFHSLLTWPIANLLLLLLAIPLIFRLGERNLFVGVGTALGLCAAYFAVETLCQDLGSRNVLPPVLGAWLPVILFGSLTVALRDALRG